jgi:hypothetical protein
LPQNESHHQKSAWETVNNQCMPIPVDTRWLISTLLFSVPDNLPKGQGILQGSWDTWHGQQETRCGLERVVSANQSESEDCYTTKVLQANGTYVEEYVQR